MSKTIVIDGREILGSTGRYTRKLLEHLPELDKNNSYHVLLHPEAMGQVSLTASNFHKVSVNQRKFTFAEQLSLPKSIQALKPDLVHFPMVNQPAFLRCSSVTTIHDLIPLRFKDPTANPVKFAIRQRVFKWLAQRVSRQAKHLITDSAFVKDDVIKSFGTQPEKISVIPLAADKITQASESVAALKDKRFIFYVGRAQAHKNLARLIEAFEAVHKTHPDLILALAGKKSDNYEYVEKLAGQSSATDAIKFTDFVSEGQLRWLYENAQAYVLPSLDEGFSLSGLEAMAQGCPVVSSNSSCLPEVYGDAAHYFDPMNPTDMAQKISDVISDPKRRAELIGKGLAQVTKYSWARMAQQTLKVYKMILDD